MILPAEQHIKLWGGKYKYVPRNNITKGRTRTNNYLFIEMLLCLVNRNNGIWS